MIKDFTLFGERNSGTQYLLRVLNETINLPFTQEYGFKHWFIKDLEGRGRPNTTTDNGCLRPLDGEHSRHTLFILTFRNPFDWAAAMYRRPYHIKDADMSSLLAFLKSPCISYETARPPGHGEDTPVPWTPDPRTGTYFIEESRNIITLRNEKNDHFAGLLQRVHHVAIIRQEFLLNDLKGMIKGLDLPLRRGEPDISASYRQPASYHLGREEKDFIRAELDNVIDDTYYQDLL